jgi:hypothetical protein
MRQVRRGLLGFFATAALAVGILGIGAGAASAGPKPPSGNTCTGGSVAGGNYDSLVIAGACAVDSGPVTVQGDLIVKPGADLYAAFGGSDLTVGGNLSVGANAVVVLGCEASEFPCLNDDQNNPTMNSSDSVGNLNANGALAVLSHNNAYFGDVNVHGGGGGLDCDPRDALMGGPAYGTFEDDTIGGSASITGFHSCWLGFFRENVAGSVQFNGNRTLDPDGNEVQTNTIGGDLACQGNSPKPQQGDSEGSPNVVGGQATGQCSDLVAP